MPGLRSYVRIGLVMHRVLLQTRHLRLCAPRHSHPRPATPSTSDGSAHHTFSHRQQWHPIVAGSTANSAAARIISKLYKNCTVQNSSHLDESIRNKDEKENCYASLVMQQQLPFLLMRMHIEMGIEMRVNRIPPPLPLSSGWPPPQVLMCYTLFSQHRSYFDS